MDHTKPNDRFRISHHDGSVTALDEYGHVVGWTEHGLSGWSAFWYAAGESNRQWADSPEAAAVALDAGIAEEASL